MLSVGIQSHNIDSLRQKDIDFRYARIKGC